MKRIKRCTCGDFAKLRKVSEVSYAVICNTCGKSGHREYLDEDHTICEIQNIAIEEWNEEVVNSENFN